MPRDSLGFLEELLVSIVDGRALLSARGGRGGAMIAIQVVGMRSGKDDGLLIESIECELPSIELE